MLGAELSDIVTADRLELEDSEGTKGTLNQFIVQSEILEGMYQATNCSQ